MSSFFKFAKEQGFVGSEGALNAVLRLRAEGSTVPFIARYRKEQTSNLNDEEVQRAFEIQDDFDEIVSRQTFIVGEIEKQGRLTDELKTEILATWARDRLEDLYLPYKQKRKSKASLAREAGLDQLAHWIWEVGHGLISPDPELKLDLWAFSFKNEAKGFSDAEACLQGATDILVERLSEDLDLRSHVRSIFSTRGFVKSVKAEKAKSSSKYSNYFDFEEPISSLLESKNTHRYLAVRRGWIEEELKLSLGGAKSDETFETDLLSRFLDRSAANRPTLVQGVLEKAARVALKAHVLPSIDNEFQKRLKESADHAAIHVFAENVRKLLLASPYGSHAVLGIDPGIRTGCKIAVVDGAGKFIADSVIKLNSDEEKLQATQFLLAVIASGQIEAIAIGNGTNGRETEIFVRSVIKEAGITHIPVVLVSESGASVYSASPVAREEFPNLDVTVRGAISIARRFQDPLAELVKIDPRSIGVGQYQHDVSQVALKRSLDAVVDLCVNAVGVNLNTGSTHLLSHVSGIGEALARGIVEYRQQFGLFTSRAALLNVPRFSKKAFEQAAGFLRVPSSENPLDHTGVHPEREKDLEELAAAHGKVLKDLLTPEGARWLRDQPEAKEKFGPFTLQDIVTEIEKPGRDPRQAFETHAFRTDIFKLEDVSAGMVCPGVVTNVANFGAFVDIGVHQDGLVHISQLGQKFVSDPREVVGPGDWVSVRVLEVNLEKRQLALTMRMDEKTERKPKSEKKRNQKTAPKNEPEKTLVVQYQEPAAARPKPVVSAAASLAPAERPRSKASQKPASTSHARIQQGGAASKAKPQTPFNNAFAGLAALREQSAKK
jgi:protein Tex